jgi:hypothetical protein
LPVAGNGTGNEEKGESPLTSGACVNAAPATSAIAVGNETAHAGSIVDLADNFLKTLRAEQEGLSPEFKNQSPQEKCLRALATPNKNSLTRMQNKDLAKAIHQASK